MKRPFDIYPDQSRPEPTYGKEWAAEPKPVPPELLPGFDAVRYTPPEPLEQQPQPPLTAEQQAFNAEFYSK